MRDHSGREVGIYDKDDGWKSFNLFGNGLIGRADVYYQSVWVEDPEEGMVEVQQRFDERFYYIKDPHGDRHLGSIQVTIDQTNQVTAAQDYSAYGEIWRDINTSTPTDSVFSSRGNSLLISLVLFKSVFFIFIVLMISRVIFRLSTHC